MTMARPDGTEDASHMVEVDCPVCEGGQRAFTNGREAWDYMNKHRKTHKHDSYWVSFPMIDAEPVPAG